MMISPNNRRLIVIALSVFIVSSIYLCTTRLFAMSFTPHDAATKSGNGLGDNLPPDFKLTHADLPMSYGDYDRPKIEGLETLVGYLDEEVIPTPENQRRLVVVGDIHGMDAALDALLKKVAFNTTTDHLIAVGDMVNKGPDSGDVIQRLIKLRASAVRGNHEDRVLLSRAEIDSQTGIAADLDSIGTEDRKGQLADIVTARLLTQEQVDWLKKLPVIIDINELGLHIVHAGLMPGIALDKQDPWAAMNMRTINYPREALRRKEGEKPLRRRAAEDDKEKEELKEIPETSVIGNVQHDDSSLLLEDEEVEDAPGSALNGQPRDGPGAGGEEEDEIDTTEITFDRAVAVPSAGSDGDAWNEAWDKWQKRLHKDERYTVIYGHDARHGYVETKYTFGLDSGCVKGEELTALIITAREGGGFKYQRAQVKCHGR
jgi:bis(5'-nucleosyl)-tetraphosphatase (symmetrical)